MVFPIISCAKHNERVVAVGGDCYHSTGSTSDRKQLDEKKQTNKEVQRLAKCCLKLIRHFVISVKYCWGNQQSTLLQ